MHYPSIIVWLIILVTASNCYAQQNNTVTLSKSSYTISELITEIESQSDFFFAFNTDILSDGYILNFDDDQLALDEIIKEWDTYYPYNLRLEESTQKIILSRSNNYRVQGIVIDSFSGELMQDVSIIDTKNKGHHTNSEGYFSFMLTENDKSVYFSHIGYKLKNLSREQIGGSGMIVYLNSAEYFPDIVILDTPIRENQFNQLQKHTQKQVETSFAISGRSDILSYLKSLPSVSVGSEGQNGFNVRGGGNEQNLILLDGIPIYEASHLGGVSSIFLTDAIKSFDFYSSGMPARYGGKLSSVLDVRLKEGNRNEFKRSVVLGLEGIQANIEGPLSNNLSINLNAKRSYFSDIARPYLKSNLNLSNVDLSYQDYYAKVSYWFSPSNRLTLSAYTGNDRIVLQREFEEDNNALQDLNRVNWGNKVLGLQWNAAIQDKLFVNLSVGYSEYQFKSFGSYAIQFVTDDDQLDTSSYTIVTSSKMRDLIATGSIDYYSDNLGKFKVGASMTKNRNEPSIIQELDFLVEEPILTPFDTTYNSIEASIYLENEFQISKQLKLFSGLRYNYFSTQNSNYNFLNPRVKIQYNQQDYTVSASYSKLNQFIHLLANPGPGLPSDLWVPSTDHLRPQSSHNYDLSYYSRKNRLSYGASIFYKEYSDLIDYDNPSEIIYSFIINTELFNIDASNFNWEDRISIGSGRSYGIEVNGAYAYEDVSFSLAYTLSKTTRTFQDINDGEPFPYKYDRRHNVSCNLSYKISDRHSIRANFAYGTGNAFTIPDTRVKGPDGNDILVALSRNSYRIPSFHHLDLNYSFKKKIDNKTFSLNVGVYNVYNRLNSFYVYVQQSEFDNVEPIGRSVSIYPILPQLNVGWTW